MITYANKNKFGAPPINEWRDVDANEVKDAINILYNRTVSEIKYGKLYPWLDATLKPFITGYTIGSNDDWTQLTDYIQTEITAGRLDDVGVGNILKSCRQVGSPLLGACATSTQPRWNADGTNYGRDSVGFSALPAGARSLVSTYVNIGTRLNFWASTIHSEGRAFARRFQNNTGTVDAIDTVIGAGVSIRLTRPATTAEQALADGTILEKIQDRNGNVYDVVKIGQQAWTKRNVAASLYADGTAVTNCYDYNDDDSNTFFNTTIENFETQVNILIGRTTVSVADAGIIGDSATDWTIPLQAFIHANKGKAIYFPAGIYLITDEIIIEGSNTVIYGDGRGNTEIRQRTADKNGLFFRPATFGIVGSRLGDVGINDIQVSINLASGQVMTDFTKSAVRMVQCYRYIINDVTFSSVARALSIEGCDRGFYNSLYLRGGSASETIYNGEDSNLLYMADYQLLDLTYVPNWVHHFNRFLFELGHGTSDLLTLNVAPATVWAANDVITGQTSGATCVVLSQTSDFIYRVASVTGVFLAGEQLGVTGNAGKLALQTATFPFVTIGTSSIYDTGIMVARSDGLFFENGYLTGGGNSQIKFKPLHNGSNISKFSLDNVYFDGNGADRRLKYNIEIPYTAVTSAIRLHISEGCFLGNAYLAAIYSRSVELEKLVCNATIAGCDMAIDILGATNRTELIMNGNHLSQIGRSYGGNPNPGIKAGLLQVLKLNGCTIESSGLHLVEVVDDIKVLQLCDNTNLANVRDVSVTGGTITQLVMKGNVSSRPAIDEYNWSVNVQQNRYSWFDNDGKLRTKATAPTSHDDGDLIGLQS